MRTLILLSYCFAAATIAAAGDTSIPVMVGGESDLDACGGQGQVTGLDPKGDNFLTVRSGPGTRYVAVDRLKDGTSISLCDSRGNWLGVVYGGKAECNVGSPIATRQNYDGPCKSGWVYRAYIKETAG